MTGEGDLLRLQHKRAYRAHIYAHMRAHTDLVSVQHETSVVPGMQGAVVVDDCEKRVLGVGRRVLL